MNSSKSNHYALQSLKESQGVLNAFVSQENLLDSFDRAVEILVNSFQSGIPVISCGNGGSTCDAMHFAEEFTGRYQKDRAALPALAVSDPSHLTCVANDFGFEEVFARQVEAFGRKGGALLAISTSGNSKNVIKAIQAAKKRGVFVIGLSGENGGEMKPLCDVCFLVPSRHTDRIQEVHIKIIHNLIEGVERKLFPENYTN